MTGLRLRAIRTLAGIRQEELSEIVGVDQSTWSKWEKGKRQPDLFTITKFAARSQASLDLIYRGVPGDTNPLLVRLLRATHPELLASEPIDTPPDKDTATASYRDAIRQE